jgi:hypothetical protein
MAWYNTGTIALTNGSATVTGSGTNFSVGAQIGEALYAPDGKLYEIQTINSATVITLASNYLGSTASAQGYQIIPTQSLVADLASDVTDLISDFADVRDYAGNGKFNDGAVGTPGITFTQDQDNGLYRIGSNNWALAAGGQKIVDISTSGIGVTGTVTASAGITATTGTFSSSTVTINNAAANLRFENGAGTRTGYIQSRADAFEVWNDQAVPMVFGTNNTTRLTIASTGAATFGGNVGVGSSDFGSGGSINLSVGVAGVTAGGLQLWASSAQTHYMQFGDATAGGAPYSGAIGYNHATDSLLFLTAGSPKLTIASTGAATFSGSVTATGGVVFGDAGGSGTPTSNTLDSYEEGTWTPAYNTSNGDLANFSMFTGSTQGKYTKVGNQVTVYGSLATFNAASISGTGIIRITGLPFAAVGNVNGEYKCVALTSDNRFTNNPSFGQISNGTTRLDLYKTNAMNAANSMGVGDMNPTNTANYNLAAFVITYITS